MFKLAKRFEIPIEMVLARGYRQEDAPVVAASINNLFECFGWPRDEKELEKYPLYQTKDKSKYYDGLPKTKWNEKIKEVLEGKDSEAKNKQIQKLINQMINKPKSQEHKNGLKVLGELISRIIPEHSIEKLVNQINSKINPENKYLTNALIDLIRLTQERNMKNEVTGNIDQSLKTNRKLSEDDQSGKKHYQLTMDEILQEQQIIHVPSSFENKKVDQYQQTSHNLTEESSENNLMEEYQRMNYT